MSMLGDMARESLTQFLCQLLIKKMRKRPEARIALCEIGLEMLDSLDYNPPWAKDFYRIFRKGAWNISAMSGISSAEEKWSKMDSTEDRYRPDWLQLCAGLGVKNQDKALSIYKELFFLYETRGRYYHNLFHIYEILSDVFPEISRWLLDKPAVHMSIWFHDAVYNPKASDNEEKSATFARKKIKELGLPDIFGDKVSTLILATKCFASPNDSDACYLVDMDFSIFGQSEIIFDAYEDDIGREYSWMPKAAFAKGRKRLLERFLHRPWIYHTDFFRNKLEIQARKNLERSLKKL